ncbi:MAG: disulfide bond formation protein DsbA [Actinobacteria bacterium]|nr:disulfide bond formation protein DsbA [Actinomycetota bacterium]
MPTPVRFWLDPACPFCWATSLWLREVAPERDLEISWQPISLLVKNETSPDSPWYSAVKWSYDLLRVLESVRAAEGETAVGDLYLEYGRRIHHDGQREWDVTLALEAVGLPTSHAAAADDESWDAEVLRRHHEGVALVGTDVGTPIIGLLGRDGAEVGVFGPVISALPAHDDALALWDATVLLATMPEFFELKRSRKGAPDPGPRP